MPKYIIDTNNKKSKISREIYGHFSEHLGRCIYEGLYVGENSQIPNTNGMRNDVVEALKTIKVPVLRWPGGCFADEYHWKDGIGDKASRKKMINTHWGGVVEDNSFGTHEFMELCRQIGCEPYINGNLGSGTVAEMSEWVEYMTFDGVSPMAALRESNGQKEPWKLKYFGVGNENWGCGGHMRPEYYADEYRRYQTYVRNYSGNNIFKIACGANVADYNWTEVLMRQAGRLMHGLSLHYYTHPGTWEEKGLALEFTDEVYYETLMKSYYMNELVEKHSAIMDKYDPQKRVAMIVDEWGTWFLVEPGTNPGFLYQQNTMRDAMVAGQTLNIFNKHSDRVRMANLAQTVNVLQALVLTEGEKMLLTPTYHVFDLYKVHQDATLLDSFIENITFESAGKQTPVLSESASINDDGTVNVTICNISLDKSLEIDAEVLGGEFTSISGEILSGQAKDHNTFDNTEIVKNKPFTDTKLTEKGFVATLPPVSAVRLTLSNK